ncbi:MAG: SGNH/GDSL hydrolase family protein [Nibricoccus sp.]
MKTHTPRRPWLGFLLIAGLLAISSGCGFASATDPLLKNGESWVTAWTTAPLAETPGKDTPALKNATLRQVVRVTAAGRAIRIRIGNYFGKEPLELSGVRLNQMKSSAKAAAEIVYFGGAKAVSVAPGEAVVSDPVQLPVDAGTDLSVAFHIAGLPATLTAHPGARATSYVTPGNVLDETNPAAAPLTCTRWYFLCGIDVCAASTTALAILGDSITDGYGCPPDSHSRWVDGLARRLQANSVTSRVAVLNLGIGGNRLLRDGLGPKAVARVERDVFGQHGVTCLMIFIGINDIGTRVDARKKGAPYASADDIIGGLKQIAEEARKRGLKVVGATITPYGGNTGYWSEDGEADRQKVNAWIRDSGSFDAVVDFDAVVRDPAQPDRLAAAFDCGDHLHPSLAGYARMAEAVDLSVFIPASQEAKSSKTALAAP